MSFINAVMKSRFEEKKDYFNQNMCDLNQKDKIRNRNKISIVRVKSEHKLSFLIGIHVSNVIHFCDQVLVLLEFLIQNIYAIVLFFTLVSRFALQTKKFQLPFFCWNTQCDRNSWPKKIMNQVTTHHCVFLS